MSGGGNQGTFDLPDVVSVPSAAPSIDPPSSPPPMTGAKKMVNNKRFVKDEVGKVQADPNMRLSGTERPDAPGCGVVTWHEK